MQTCQDNYYATFSSYPMILDCHEEQAKKSLWKRCQVNRLRVEPIDETAPLYVDISRYAEGISTEAVCDTAENLGLAIRVDGKLYPLRNTAYKTLLDRAKIGGSALSKLDKRTLAGILNACFDLHEKANALVLVRDEKVSAVHAGDEADYSILPIDELLKTLKAKLDSRFPGNVFETGYSDHSITSGIWRMPAQKEDLIGAYTKTLEAMGHKKRAEKLVPGIRFTTSDTGVASAKVSAMLMDGRTVIHIGSCVAIDHRHNAKVEEFETALDQLFAQFGDNIKKLQSLFNIQLEYPINAMQRICKKLSMPKKAAVEAISMFEMYHGLAPATAHDVFMAMQEILFLLKAEKVGESKLLDVEENMARVLDLRWEDYDLPKGVDY